MSKGSRIRRTSDQNLYEGNWDKIFGKKEEPPTEVTVEVNGVEVEGISPEFLFELDSEEREDS